MPKKKKLQNQPPVQTGRTLPSRVTSYSPGRPQNPAATAVQPRSKKSAWKRTLAAVLAAILIAVLLLGVWDARNISAASKKMFGNGSILTIAKGGPLKSEADGRVNVLIAGYSIDDPGHPGAALTDSIILLSMSPTSKTGYMLSIPRDLYVKIPGFGYAKINEAYSDGGMPLLEQVVSSDFGVTIDYYTLVNYSAVRDTVNALGGVSINIQSQDPRGLYDPNISRADGGPLRLANGLQTLDGQTALNLTRARGDAYGSYGFAQADFDRTQHQRQVFRAIKYRLNWTLVLNPRKNSQILNAVAGNVKTDLSASGVRPLFGLFNSIPGNSLKSLSLRNFNGQNYLGSYTTAYGQSALVPAAGLNDYSQIVSAISQLSQ